MARLGQNCNSRCHDIWLAGWSRFFQLQNKDSTEHPNGAISTQKPEADLALPAPSTSRDSRPVVDMLTCQHVAPYSSVTTTTMISDTYVPNPSLSIGLVIDQSALVFTLREYNAGRGDLCQQNEFGAKSGQGAW